MGIISKIVDKAVDKNLSFDNTVACISKIKKDVKNIIKAIDIIVQIIFIGFYVYMLCTHLDKPISMTIYIVLVSISSLFLLFNLFTIATKNKRILRIKQRVIKRTVSIVKMCIQTVVIGVSIYEIVRNGSTDAKLLLTITSSAFLLINICATLLGYYINNMIDMLAISFKLDSERNVLFRFTERKGIVDSDEMGMSEKEKEKLTAKVKKQTFDYYGEE